jgi:hypothetical protein
MNYAKTVFKLREQILKFSGELSWEWPKVLRRFIAEAIYGIQARQSVRLTEIARALEVCHGLSGNKDKAQSLGPSRAESRTAVVRNT